MLAATGRSQNTPRRSSAGLAIRRPFVDGQPIPGWSGLLDNGDGTFTALPDNGYGSKANSSDYIIGTYTTLPTFKTADDGSNVPGNIENLEFTPFNDSLGLLQNGQGIDLLITADLPTYRSGDGFGDDSGIPVDIGIVEERLLTGYDFDVESIARVADGSVWVGEELGPYLLHFDAEGTLIEEPVPHPFLTSPSNPLVITLPGTETQASSRGFESIALNEAKDKLYAIPEAAPLSDELRAVPGDERVVEMFEFDPATSAYTGARFKYQKDGDAVGNAIVIGDMTNVGQQIRADRARQLLRARGGAQASVPGRSGRDQCGRHARQTSARRSAEHLRPARHWR